MEFKSKVKLFQKMLFVGYVRNDKITLEDWYEEGLKLATEISDITKRDEGIKRIDNYLSERFETDTFTNFNYLATCMFDKFKEISSK